MLVVVRWLFRLAPEEIAAIGLLAILLAVAAVRPATITDMLQTPYATPAPEGGPARLLVPEGVP